MYPRRYCPPASTAAWSGVNRPTSASARNCISTTVTAPNPQARPMAQNRVCFARSGFPAPRFCAPSAETADSINDGTRNRKPMIFSTIPTAAASVSPRRLAMTVITMKEIWINLSCTEMGTPIFKIASITGFCGRRSAFASGMVLLRTITARLIATLMACESDVPSAAPAGPRCSAPINR